MAKLTISDEPPLRRLTIEGDLGQQGTSSIEKEFATAAGDSRLLMIDLSGVSMVASPGITMLVTAARHTSQHGGRTMLFGATPMVAEVLRRCRLDEILGLVATADEARRQLQSHVAPPKPGKSF